MTDAHKGLYPGTILVDGLGIKAWKMWKILTEIFLFAKFFCQVSRTCLWRPGLKGIQAGAYLYFD